MFAVKLLLLIVLCFTAAYDQPHTVDPLNVLVFNAGILLNLFLCCLIVLGHIETDGDKFVLNCSVTDLN